MHRSVLGIHSVNQPLHIVLEPGYIEFGVV